MAVYGDDALRVREFSQDLLDKFFIKYDASRLNGEVLDFATSSREHIVTALRSAPFLAEKRFILLQNVADVLKKSDAIFWFDLFESLDPSVVLCFADVCDVAGWKKSILGSMLLQKDSWDVKHYPLSLFSRSELFQWIRSRAAKYASTFSDDALALLQMRVGDSCEELALEIHKLATYASRETITREMVLRLVPLRVSPDFFGFLDAISSQTPKKTLEIFLKEMDAGTDGFALFGGLLRQLRIFVSISDLLRSDIRDQKHLAETLSLHPFVVQKAVVAVRGFSHEQLVDLLDRAIFWDKQTKQGISADVLAERLLEGILFARISPLA